jgi:hypothetical protein
MSQRHYSSGFLSVKNLRWSPCSFQPRHATIKRLITDLQTHHRFLDKGEKLGLVWWDTVLQCKMEHAVVILHEKIAR